MFKLSLRYWNIWLCLHASSSQLHLRSAYSDTNFPIISMVRRSIGLGHSKSFQNISKYYTYTCRQYWWWFRNPANQLRLVGYPNIYKVFTFQVVCRISSINTCKYIFTAQLITKKHDHHSDKQHWWHNKRSEEGTGSSLLTLGWLKYVSTEAFRFGECF